MLSHFHFLLLVLTYIGGIHLAVQDDCVPGNVVNLTLSGDSILSWEQPDDEQCEISSYLVSVTLSDGSVIWEYIVTETSVDVGHLTPCERYIFRVHEITADNITSNGWAIYVVTPPPPDADLKIQYLNVTQTGRNVRLQWSLDSNWIQCASHYRVLVYNDDDDSARDIYTALTSVIINNIVPCTNYVFGVRALFTLEEEGPVILVPHTGDEYATAHPQLESVALFPTRTLFRWQLEPYSENRCPISEIIIDGSPSFNISQQVLDQPNRSRVSVVVNNLTPNTLYFIRATVVNSAGSSGPFQMAFQTLQQD